MNELTNALRGKEIGVGVLLCAIFGAAALRLIPHPPNFTPTGAMALFSGAQIGRRPLALAAPLSALFLSDLILGFYDGMMVVYAATALIVLLSWFTLRRVTAARLAVASLACSTVFFVITNLGVWLSAGLYPRTWDGLSACYVAALPFFQNAVVGDFVFSILIFGSFAALQYAQHLRPSAT
jgi:hypothetical protein